MAELIFRDTRQKDGTYKPQPTGEVITRCKNCAHFNVDYCGEFNGIPIIIAHDICNFWGGGCKTEPDGYCKYGIPKGPRVDNYKFDCVEAFKVIEKYVGDMIYNE